MMQNRQRVVITGMGTYNPLGHDSETTWRSVKEGKSGIGPITLFDTTDHKTHFAAEVDDFDAVGLFGRKEARRMDRVTQFILAAADQALADSGLALDGTDRARIGVVAGSGMGLMTPIVEAAEAISSKGPTRVSPFFVPMMLPDTPAAVISIRHGLQGPNMIVATACATGNTAIGEAAQMIRYGVADVMFAGSSEACIIPLAVAGFNSMGALSTRNEAFHTASRPFDKTRDGFVVGEGAGVLILESLAHALARDAHIYGEFLGYGSSADAYHISTPLPDGGGAAQSMALALKDAGLPTTAVDYINAHGTSTPLNDKGETAAIKTVFGEKAYDMPISSTKSMHGHLLGATSSLEAIISLKSLNEGVLPATINYETPDPECDLDYIPNHNRVADVNVIMSNGFGLGGHNATIILGKYEEDKS